MIYDLVTLTHSLTEQVMAGG